MKINHYLFINDSEIEFSFIKSAGPGGQNVNKVATAVLLRFNVLLSSSIQQDIKDRLRSALSNKLTAKGELLIKANRFRTQERNKQDAIDRLTTLLQKAIITQKKRKKTKPTKASIERRLNNKKRLSLKKTLRQN